uniref:Uncharacterized protein n=1 Tax=Cacopsylla melanoneura TaxID=428564 RepID=A0A8D9DW13_9HEMI
MLFFMSGSKDQPRGPRTDWTRLTTSFAGEKAKNNFIQFDSILLKEQLNMYLHIFMTRMSTRPKLTIYLHIIYMTRISTPSKLDLNFLEVLKKKIETISTSKVLSSRKTKEDGKERANRSGNIFFLSRNVQTRAGIELTISESRGKSAIFLFH